MAWELMLNRVASVYPGAIGNASIDWFGLPTYFYGWLAQFGRCRGSCHITLRIQYVQCLSTSNYIFCVAGRRAPVSQLPPLQNYLLCASEIVHRQCSSQRSCCRGVTVDLVCSGTPSISFQVRLLNDRLGSLQLWVPSPRSRNCHDVRC